MDKYEVKITDEALADMEKIYEYIAIQLLAPENTLLVCWNDRKDETL